MPLYLDEDAALISGVYTIPEYRGQGIATNLKNEISTCLKNTAIKYLIEVVHQNFVLDTDGQNLHKLWREYD